MPLNDLLTPISWDDFERSKTFQDLPLNEQAQKKLRYFEKYGREEAARQFEKRGLPGALGASIVQQESRGNPYARSKDGAYGLMQLMPAAAHDVQVDRFDPYQNVTGGADYFGLMYDKTGSIPDAIGAYHSGFGNKDKLGPAGRGYVARVLQGADAGMQSLPPPVQTANPLLSTPGLASDPAAGMAEFSQRVKQSKLKTVSEQRVPTWAEFQNSQTFRNLSREEQLHKQQRYLEKYPDDPSAQLQGPQPLIEPPNAPLQPATTTGASSTAPGVAGPPPALLLAKDGAAIGAAPTAPATPGAGAVSLPPLGTEIVGKTPQGRPIIRNPDGSVSSHRNMIAGFGDSFYIVPTIYGGKEYTPDQAADIIRKNNLVDPDTGEQLTPYASEEEAEIAEKTIHDRMEQEMVQQGVLPPPLPLGVQAAPIARGVQDAASSTAPAPSLFANLPAPDPNAHPPLVNPQFPQSRALPAMGDVPQTQPPLLGFSSTTNMQPQGAQFLGPQQPQVSRGLGADIATAIPRAATGTTSQFVNVGEALTNLLTAFSPQNAEMLATGGSLHPPVTAPTTPAEAQQQEAEGKRLSGEMKKPFEHALQEVERFEQRNPKWFAPSEEEKKDWVRSALVQGPTSALQSMATGIPALMAGGLPALVMSGGTLFSIAEWQQAERDINDYNKGAAKDKKIPDDVATQVKAIRAIAEGGGEMVSDFVGGKLLGLDNFFKGAGKLALSKVLTPSLRATLKKVAGVAVTETGSEMGTAAVQAEANKRAGMPGPGALESALQAGPPSLVAALIFAGVGHGTQRAIHHQVRESLSNPQTAPEQRMEAAHAIGEAIKEEKNPALAQQFTKAAAAAIQRGEAINLDLTAQQIADLEQQRANQQGPQQQGPPPPAPPPGTGPSPTQPPPGPRTQAPSPQDSAEQLRRRMEEAKARRTPQQPPAPSAAEQMQQRIEEAKARRTPQPPPVSPEQQTKQQAEEAGTQLSAPTVTPADVHSAADAAGILWDNDPAFTAWTKNLTGQEHLDNLDEKGLSTVLDAIQNGQRPSSTPAPTTAAAPAAVAEPPTPTKPREERPIFSVKTRDGHVTSDPNVKSHNELVQKHGIGFENVQETGFLVGGQFQPKAPGQDGHDTPTVPSPATPQEAEPPPTPAELHTAAQQVVSGEAKLTPPQREGIAASFGEHGEVNGRPVWMLTDNELAHAYVAKPPALPEEPTPPSIPPSPPSTSSNAVPTPPVAPQPIPPAASATPFQTDPALVTLATGVQSGKIGMTTSQRKTLRGALGEDETIDGVRVKSMGDKTLARAYLARATPKGVPNANEIPGSATRPVGEGPGVSQEIRGGNTQEQAVTGEGQATPQEEVAPPFPNLTPIGKNRNGDFLYEDANGIRSVLDDERFPPQREVVQMRPARGGTVATPKARAGTSYETVAERERTNPSPVTPQGQETTPPQTDRAALIERIVMAARDPPSRIVPARQIKGDNGKWYPATEVPRGVKSTGETRIEGYYVFSGPQGTTQSRRFPTEVEARQFQDQIPARADAAMRASLEESSPQRLQERAAYWLKEKQPPAPPSPDVTLLATAREMAASKIPVDRRGKIAAEKMRQALGENTRYTGSKPAYKGNLLKYVDPRYVAEEYVRRFGEEQKTATTATPTPVAPPPVTTTKGTPSKPLSEMRLSTAIATMGGIHPSPSRTGEIRNLAAREGGKLPPGVFKNGGHNFDDPAFLAQLQQEGFDIQNADDLWAALGKEARGEPVYSSKRQRVANEQDAKAQAESDARTDSDRALLLSYAREHDLKNVPAVVNQAMEESNREVLDAVDNVGHEFLDQNQNPIDFPEAPRAEQTAAGSQNLLPGTPDRQMPNTPIKAPAKSTANLPMFHPEQATQELKQEQAQGSLLPTPPTLAPAPTLTTNTPPFQSDPTLLDRARRAITGEIGLTTRDRDAIRNALGGNTTLLGVKVNGMKAVTLARAYVAKAEEQPTTSTIPTPTATTATPEPTLASTPATTTAEPAPTPTSIPTPTPNRLVSKEAADAARERLRKKLNQVNVGLDPEIFKDGITLTLYHLEEGARKFAAYSKAMLDDLGEVVKPYLRQWYEGARYEPGFDATGMSTAEEIAAEANAPATAPETPLTPAPTPEPDTTPGTTPQSFAIGDIVRPRPGSGIQGKPEGDHVTHVITQSGQQKIRINQGGPHWNASDFELMPAQGKAPTTEATGPSPTASLRVADWVEGQLTDGIPITSRALFDVADAAFGGTQAQGTYTPKDAYDAMEMGVNLHVEENGISPIGELPQVVSDVNRLNKLQTLLPTQTKRTEEQDEFQQFSTPPALAYTVAWVANLNGDDTVLEPSAGLGGIAVFAKNAGAQTVVNELSPRRAALLKQMGFDRTFTENAEQLDNILPTDVQPTVVLMNPPFSSTAGRMQGQRKTRNATRHIEQALARLAPGGRLVAIVGKGMAEDAPTFTQWWNGIKAQYNVRANTGMNGREYAKYGTVFDNQLVVIDKTGPTPNLATVTDNVETVGALLPLLERIRNDRPTATVQPSQPRTSESPRPQTPTGSRGAPGPNPTSPTPAPPLGPGIGEGPTPPGTPRPNREQPGDTGSSTATASPQVVPGEPGGAAGQQPGTPQREGAGEPSGVPVPTAPESAPSPNSDTTGVTEADDTAPDVPASVYEPYRPQKLEIPGAQPHPGVLVQSAAMASVEPPTPTYTPNLPPDVITSGRLSIAQLEAVVYAGQAHSQTLPNGQRKGFMIGDNTGVGKGRSQPVSAKVLTPHGWKLMGDIVIGDEVIAVDGSSTTVIGVYPQGKKKIFAVTFSDGSKTECSEDHLWLTQTRQQRHYEKIGQGIEYPKPKIRTTAELRKTLQLYHTVPLVSPVQFPSTPVFIDPWLLGVLLGDGCIRQSSVQVVAADYQVLEGIKEMTALDGLATRKVASREYHYGITKPHRAWLGKPRQSNPLVSALRKYKLTGKTALHKFIPEEYKLNSPEVRLGILQGLMDTDGYVNKKGACLYYSISPQLADDVVFLVRSLGGVVTRGIKKTPHHPCHVLYIKMPAGMNPFRLERKAERVRKDWVKYPPTRIIRSIEEVGQKEAQCIAVDHPSRLYVTDDFIVTHNTISGIMLDNLRQGRKKAVWVSVNNKLFKDAQRDFAGVGGDPKRLFALNDLKAGVPIGAQEGILFVSYDTLKSGAKDTRDAQGNLVPGQKRLDQLTAWLGEDFDGVIAYDEAHSMGNSIAQAGTRGQKKAAAKAIAGVTLQNTVPNARVVYVSATGATEVSNLAYANRLGLWGADTSFPNVQAFIDEVSAGGLAAMELVARDMKQQGCYIARSLSFDDVRYRTLEHPLTEEQRTTYNEMADAWQIVLNNLNQALSVTSAKKNGAARSAALSAFWSGQQRFFNQVLSALQMPSALSSMRNDLAEGKAVVLQLVNTNEAIQDRQLALMEDQSPEELATLDITPRENLMQYLRNSFPVMQFEEYLDDQGNERSRVVTDADGNPVENRQAIAMREALLDRLSTLRVPEGALDMVLNTFGHQTVAEVTGRSQRVVRDPNTGVTEKQSRSQAAALADAAAFMGDKKQILIFSDAGGTGQSYHADRAHPNQRPRVHYLIQPGWRADRAVQGMGRTHRTNEASAPEYVLVTTDIKGQKRFISSIARRLDQLGALTKGQRQTGSQGLFSAKDNLESEYARDAMVQFWTDLHRNRIPDLDFSTVTQQMGLSLRDSNGNLKSELPPVTQFMNRMLALNVDQQNSVFDAFFSRIEERVAQAIADDTLDAGLETLTAQKTEVKHEQTVYTDTNSGAETKYVELELTQPRKITSFAEAKELPRVEGFYLNEKSGRVSAVYEAGTRTNERGGIEQRYVSVSPTSRLALDADSFAKLKQLSPREAEQRWEQTVRDTPPTYTEHKHLITGALLPIWNRLAGPTRVVRAKTQDGRRLLGRLINEDDLERTLENLGASTSTPTVTPTEAMQRILDENAQARLANGWRIKRSLVSGDQRLEMLGDPHFSYAETQQLQAEGAFTERINYQLRVFLPADPTILERILRSRPITRMIAAVRTAADVLANQHGQIATDIFSAPARAIGQAARRAVGGQQTEEAATQQTSTTTASPLANQRGAVATNLVTAPLRAIGQAARRTMGDERIELESMLGGGQGEKAFDDKQGTKMRIGMQQLQVAEYMSELLTHPGAQEVLVRVFGTPFATRISRFFRSFEMTGRLFGVPASRQDALFNAAESIKDFSPAGVPNFGTRVFEKDPKTDQYLRDASGNLIVKGWRYTPKEGQDFWNDLNGQEKVAVKYWVDMRDTIKTVYNVAGEIEGYVHHFWDHGFLEGLSTMMGHHVRLRKVKAGPRHARHATEGTGNVRDFERAIVIGWSKLIKEDEWNKMVTRLTPLVTRKIDPTVGVLDGWTEIPKTQPTRRGTFISQLGGGRQIPTPLYNEMIAWGDHVKDTTILARTARAVGSYMTANLLMFPGTITTNVFGSGIQYANFVLDTGVKGVLTGDFKPLLDSLTAPFQALLPSTRDVLPVEMLGGRSGVASQFEEHNAAQSLFGGLLGLTMGSVDTYVKRTVALAVLKSMHVPLTRKDIMAQKEAYAEMRKIMDTFALDYDKINSRLAKFRKSAYSQWVSPFVTYGYKMMGMMGHYFAALNPGAKMEADPRFQNLGDVRPEHLERISRLIVLGTILSLISSLFPEDKDKKIGAHIPGMPWGMDRTGMLKVGETAKGEERFYRPDGHPWFPLFLSDRALQHAYRNGEDPTDELLNALGAYSPSAGPVVQAGMAAYNHWKDPERYPTGPALARAVKPLVPFGRLSEGIHRMQGGPETQSRTFWQELAEALPGTVPESLIGTRKIVIDPITKKAVMRNPTLEQLRFSAGISLRDINPVNYTKTKRHMLENVIPRITNAKTLDAYNHAVDDLKPLDYARWQRLQKQAANKRIEFEQKESRKIQELTRQQQQQLRQVPVTMPPQSGIVPAPRP